MILYAIATRDIVANVFAQPFFVPQIGLAIRSFGDECQRQEKGNTLAHHPEDFELWLLGTYDDNTGVLEAGKIEDGTRKQIAVGANYRKQ